MRARRFATGTVHGGHPADAIRTAGVPIADLLRDCDALVVFEASDLILFLFVCDPRPAATVGTGMLGASPEKASAPAPVKAQGRPAWVSWCLVQTHWECLSLLGQDGNKADQKMSFLFPTTARSKVRRVNDSCNRQARHIKQHAETLEMLIHRM